MLVVFSVIVALCPIIASVPVNECNTGFVLPGTTIQCRDNDTALEYDYQDIEYYDHREVDNDNDISLRAVFDGFGSIFDLQGVTKWPLGAPFSDKIP